MSIEQPDDLFSEEHPPADVLARMQEQEITFMTGAGQPPRDEQFDIMDSALSIYFAKNDKRKSSWRGAGWKGNLIEMRKKLDRLWAAWEEPDEKDIDEALDLINAAAFYIRCVKENNPNGNWPWPN